MEMVADIPPDWGTKPWSDCNLCSPKALEVLLRQLGAAPRRRWGQNFLLDKAAQQRLVAAAQLSPQHSVWEIGPGLGALTQHLWANCAGLTLFEIDPLLVQFYRQRLRGCRACQLVSGDVTQTWREQQGVPEVVIGNLPYNSASLILSQFAEGGFRPPLMVFTVQKEMALRLLARVRSKAYSSFSVCIQLQFELEPLFDLPAQLFYPRPNVQSTAIRLRPRQHGLSCEQVRLAGRLSRGLFAQRRKTIANNLRSRAFGALVRLPPSLGRSDVARALTLQGIQLGQRAEEITLEQFGAVARELV